MVFAQQKKLYQAFSKKERQYRPFELFLKLNRQHKLYVIKESGKKYKNIGLEKFLLSIFIVSSSLKA
jgi:hypothetical protein